MRLALRILLTAALGLELAHAAPPQTLHYQGFLTSSAGVPVNGPTQIRFQLFDAVAAGNLLWEETHASVNVANGHYQVILGNLIPLGLDFSAPYWLGIAAGADANMVPRQELAMVPYAFRAITANTADTLGGLAPSDVAPASHDHDGRYYTQSQLNAVGTLNAAANPVDWTRLKNVPASIVDGDNDTTYQAAAGGGLSLVGSSFRLVNCASGLFLKSGGTTWDCASSLNDLQLTPQSVAPAACTAPAAGRIYFDADDATLCWCNGSNWVPLDGVGNCN